MIPPKAEYIQTVLKDHMPCSKILFEATLLYYHSSIPVDAAKLYLSNLVEKIKNVGYVH